MEVHARPCAVVQAVRWRAEARSGKTKGDSLTTSSLELEGDPFDALGDPNRRAIVELIATGGRSVQEIADALPISRPAVSRHLRLLKDAGLVIEEAVGTRRIYHLRADGVEAVQRYLVQVWGDAAARFRLVAENTRQPDDDP